MRASAVPLDDDDDGDDDDDDDGDDDDDDDDDDEASTFHAVLLPQPLFSNPEFALFTLLPFSGSFLHISAH